MLPNPRARGSGGRSGQGSEKKGKNVGVAVGGAVRRARGSQQRTRKPDPIESASRKNKSGSKKGKGRKPAGKDVKKDLSAERLEHQMESYWGKSDNPEIKAKLAQERAERLEKKREEAANKLQSDMNSYWAQKNKATDPQGQESKTGE